MRAARRDIRRTIALCRLERAGRRCAPRGVGTNCSRIGAVAGHARALLRFAALYTTSLAGMALVNRRIQHRTRGLEAEKLTARFAADDGDDLKWMFDGTNPGAHLAEYVIHPSTSSGLWDSGLICQPTGSKLLSPE
jgi:hypothetical protein